MTNAEAQAAAEAVGMDLVMMAENDPPVCKIMDYGKHVFESKKQKAAQRKRAKRTLQRRFERELSCRFSDLVDEVRAEMCLPLLESGVFPMQAIAEQLGYATSGNFSRFFQRRFGCTPRDWTRLAITA